MKRSDFENMTQLNKRHELSHECYRGGDPVLVDTYADGTAIYQVDQRLNRCRKSNGEAEPYGKWEQFRD
jgi:hypothetical protein